MSVSWSFDEKDIVRLLQGGFKNVTEAETVIRAAFSKGGTSQRPMGRPLQAEHPILTPDELKTYRDLLFTKLKIRSKEEWFDPKTKTPPIRFAKDQSGMDSDEIRLDNGVIALLSDIEDVPPMPRYE